MPSLLIIGNDILMVRLEYSTSKSLATVGKINDAGGVAVPGTFRLLTRLHHSREHEKCEQIGDLFYRIWLEISWSLEYLIL